MIVKLTAYYILPRITAMVFSELISLFDNILIFLSAVSSRAMVDPSFHAITTTTINKPNTAIFISLPYSNNSSILQLEKKSTGVYK